MNQEKIDLLKKVLRNAINYYGDEEGQDLLYELKRSNSYRISGEEYVLVMKELGEI